MPVNFPAFDDSQYAVYQTSAYAPLFSIDFKKANLEWFFNVMNFFCTHMMCIEYRSLAPEIKRLNPGQKPSPWRETLRQGVQPLTKHWIGTWAYLPLEEVRRLRRQGAYRSVFLDRNVEEGNLMVR